MRASAIVVAAGSGSRLGRGEPKAFVPLGGQTMLARVLRSLATVRDVAEVVIAVPAGMEVQARAEATAASLAFPVKVTAGGAERHDSVRIALALTSIESDLVLVHDAARPLAAPALFEHCLETAAQSGGAIAAIPVADTLKRVDGRLISETVARAGLWQAQTPQAFRRDILVAAHKRAPENGGIATDDAALVERIGGAVSIVDGSAFNIKVTTPEDLRMAELMIASGVLAGS
jgi:2-C-methyl-D-erythritol 4-phosphate cytidylyltransferase